MRCAYKLEHFFFDVACEQCEYSHWWQQVLFTCDASRPVWIRPTHWQRVEMRTFFIRIHSSKQQCQEGKEISGSKWWLSSSRGNFGWKCEDGRGAVHPRVLTLGFWFWYGSAPCCVEQILSALFFQTWTFVKDSGILVVKMKVVPWGLEFWLDPYPIELHQINLSRQSG